MDGGEVHDRQAKTPKPREQRTTTDDIFIMDNQAAQCLTYRRGTADFAKESRILTRN